MEVKLDPQDVVERDDAGDDDFVDLTETPESLASKAGLQLEDPSEEEDEKSEEGEQASDNDKSDAAEEDRHPRKRPQALPCLMFLANQSRNGAQSPTSLREAPRPVQVKKRQARDRRGLVCPGGPSQTGSQRSAAQPSQDAW
jgi:hypothetical protein